MLTLANCFLLFGILGLIGSTYGAALLALAFSFLKVTPTDPESEDQASSIDFLVAAHNEEVLITATLTFLATAANVFQGKVTYLVGADHCTDQTEPLAQSWAAGSDVQLSIISNPGPAGKWRMIQLLVENSEAEWVALIDCGSIWDANLLRAAGPALRNPRVMGIAPSYRAAKAGFLENLSWRLERNLKSIESKSGGPVSVHGASVLYRRKHLIQAFYSLRGQDWLNDDVVIPLTLRMEFPQDRIVYLTQASGDAWVKDQGINEARNVEYGRRKRMLIGNLQWMKPLFGRALRTNVVVGVLASRRIFRSLWAYWTSAIGIGLALRTIALLPYPVFGMTFALIGIAVGVFYPFQGSLERLRAAFYAGLEFPLHWINMTDTSSEKIWN